MNNELKRSIEGTSSVAAQMEKLALVSDDRWKRLSEGVGSAALLTKKLAGFDFGDAARTRLLNGVGSAATATERWAALSIGDGRLKRLSEGEGSAALMTEGLAGFDFGDAAKTRMFDGIGSAAFATEKLAALNVGDELKRSFAQTSLLTKDISAALHNMCIPTAAIGSPPSAFADYDTLTPMEPTPNPIWETNRQLAELTETVTQLVSVERQQAELTQAICNTANLALKNSIESGVEAKTATRVARRTIVVTIVIAILSVICATYNNHRESISTETRHQEEMRVLRDISNQLEGLTK